MADLPTGPKERKSTVLSIEDEAIIVAFRRHTFSSPSAWRGSRPTDKLFTRIRGVIKDGFADPDLGPCEVAAEAGISLRYLQKLFTERGSTCSEFIYSLRQTEVALVW